MTNVMNNNQCITRDYFHHSDKELKMIIQNVLPLVS